MSKILLNKALTMILLKFCSNFKNKQHDTTCSLDFIRIGLTSSCLVHVCISYKINKSCKKHVKCPQSTSFLWFVYLFMSTRQLKGHRFQVTQLKSALWVTLTCLYRVIIWKSAGKECQSFCKITVFTFNTDC